MKELFVQLTKDYTMAPVSKEYDDILRTFKPNQILRIKAYGTRKTRSVQQNKWLHSIFRLVSSNSEDPDWDTPEKVKRNVKMAMHFFKGDVIVIGNKVHFELRSFAFDKMDPQEASIKYEEAKLICAKKLGIDPQILETEAQREGS